MLNKRFLGGIATPPSDGAQVSDEIEFWDNACPAWMNPNPTPLGGPVPF